MRVLVIGGGLVGLSSAYALQQTGAAVEVLEARDAVGLEGSFANAGLLTAAMSDPWNSPGVHRHLAASLFDPESAMKLRLRALPGLLTWGAKFLASSRASKHLEATEANYRLAAHSIRQTRHLRESLGLEYQVGRGSLKLFRDRHAVAGPLAFAEKLALHGLRFERLDAHETVSREPQLEPIRDQITGALYFPDDEQGDALLFCRELAGRITAAGGAIRAGVSARRLMTRNGRIRGVDIDAGKIECDAVVIAAGCRSLSLLKSVGLRLPIQPVKGYSLTVDLPESQAPPSLAIVDDQMHAAVTPLGRRLRVAGTAEFAGFDMRLRPERVDNLFELLRAIYPRIAASVDRSLAAAWTGLRPVSCDGKPYIGPTTIEGLYVNAGHGHLGWTMAMGSAQLLSDLMIGRAPAIDPSPYRATRYD